MSRFGAAVAAIFLMIGMTSLSVGQASQPAGKDTTLGKSAFVADTSDDRFPADSFVAVDSVPQMEHQSAPIYPKADFKAGTTGKVYVKALVNRQGVVRKAIVLNLEQGATDAMGKAAVQAAMQNKFRPAKSKGTALACWVTYAVSFVISETKPVDSASKK